MLNLAPIAWPLASGQLTLAMVGGRLSIPGTQEFVTIPFLVEEKKKERGMKGGKGREVSNTTTPKEPD